jgi:lipoate-protein ligase B
LKSIRLIETDLTEYRQIWDLQKVLFNEVTKQRSRNYLILTEHKPVITVGTKGHLENLIADREMLRSQSIDLIDVDRGGDITYHGPGQVIGYPILDLSQFREDIDWYLRNLEQVIINSLKDFDVKGTRIPKLTGIWVGQNKICAIGVKITRWVSMHGFALNVSPSLDHFRYIIPCGIKDKGITSILQETGNIPQKNDVINSLCTNFEKIFAVKIEIPSAS